MAKNYGLQKIEKAKKLFKFLPEIAARSFFECLEGEEQTIEEMNREQMFSGEYANGNKIQPDYAPSTVVKKKKVGQPFDRVTLKDKGKYHAATTATVKRITLTISNNDSKGQWIEPKYEQGGNKLFGLNEDNHNVIVEKCSPKAAFGVMLFLRNSLK